MKKVENATFTIPKKKKKKVEQKDTISVKEVEEALPAPEKGWQIREAAVGAEVFGVVQRFAESAADKEFWAQVKHTNVFIIENKYLSWKFSECKRVLRSQNHPDTETLGFREISSQKETDYIARYGLRCGTQHFCDIGDPQYGVYLYKSPDLTSSTLHYYDNLAVTIMMFKTLRGKPNTVGLGSGDIEPQTGHFCHVAAETEETAQNEHKRRLAHRMAAVYHYEYELDGFSPRKFPANVLPYAVVRFRIDGSVKMRNPNGLLSNIFTKFTWFPVYDSHCTLKIPDFGDFPMHLQTPLRNAEVPDGLFDGEFVFGAKNDEEIFYGFESLAKFKELRMLQNRANFGRIVEQLEVVVEIGGGEEPTFLHATYNIMFHQHHQKAHQIPSENHQKFQKLIGSMQVSGVFLVGIDASETRHFMFPSGEIASSFGLPFIPDAIHVISCSNRDFYTNQFLISNVFEAESRYLLEEHQKDFTDIKIDEAFHKQCTAYYKEHNELGANLPKPAIFLPNAENPAENADDWIDIPMPPVPLPEFAGKSILFKGATTVEAEKGALIGAMRNKKRRPDVRVKWAENVVDNCDKLKSSGQMELEKKERKNQLTEEQSEALRETNDFFKSALASQNSIPKDKPKNEKLDAFGVKKSNGEKIEEPAPKPAKPEKPAEIPQIAEILSTQKSLPAVNFSTIKSLPLPIRIPEIPQIFPETAENDEDDLLEIAENDEIPAENPEIPAENVEEPTPAEKEEEVNDILNFCLSSTKPKETVAPKAIEGSLLEILGTMKPETRELLASKYATSSNSNSNLAPKDVDLRATSSSVHFQIQKTVEKSGILPKPGIFADNEDARKEEDVDYRKRAQTTRDREKERDHRETRDSRDRERDRDRDRDRDRKRGSGGERRREKEKDKDLRNIPTPKEQIEKETRKQLNNRVQDYLRANGKDYESRIDEKREMRPPTPTPSAPSAPLSAPISSAVQNIFQMLGIQPQTVSAARKCSSDENVACGKDLFDSPASPESSSTQPPPLIISTIIPTVITMDTPESPKQIEEPDEPTLIPTSILPVAQTQPPAPIPTIGDATKFYTATEVAPPAATRKKPRDFDAAAATASGSSHIKAESSWLDAISSRRKDQRQQRKSTTDTEEEGEILSDGEETAEKREEVEKIASPDIEIIEEIPSEPRIIPQIPNLAPKIIPTAPIPQIPIQIPTVLADRDDRPKQLQQQPIQMRKSRFDAPPPISRFHQGPSPLAQMRFSAGPPMNGPIGPLPPQQAGPPQVQFFNRPNFQPPGHATKAPLLPGGPTVSRHGGIRTPAANPAATPATHFGPMFQKATPPLAAVATPQLPPPTRNVVVVVDSIMFNRAVMDSNMFMELCECLRSLLMRGIPTKLYIHAQIFNNLVNSKNDNHKLYSAILLKHKDTIVFVLEQHRCDETASRGKAEAEECMLNIAARYPSHDLVYLSNLSQDSSLGIFLLQNGIRIYKLEPLMQLLKRF